MRLAVHAVHGPFTRSILEDYETENYTYCDETYDNSSLDSKNCNNVCSAMIGTDIQFGTFLDAFSNNEILNNNAWTNTFIVLTTGKIWY